MANTSGAAYALTLLCPIKQGDVTGDQESHLVNQSHAANIRHVLQRFGIDHHSPMAKAPNTYLCRFYILNDVFYEGKPAIYEQLQSQYLVFSSNFYGERDTYLAGMWTAIESDIRDVWSHCVGFDSVRDAASFINYIDRCQVKTTFFFNGSTDEPLADQLKSLYLKQELSKFAFANQGRTAAELQKAFQAFVATTKPSVVEGPTWRAGAGTLAEVTTDQNASAAHGD